MSNASISPRYVIGKVVAALIIEVYFTWFAGNSPAGTESYAPFIFVLIASSFLIFEALDTEDVDPSVATARNHFLVDAVLVAIYVARLYLLYLVTRLADGTPFVQLTRFSAALAVYFFLEIFYQSILIAAGPAGKSQSVREFWSFMTRKREEIVGRITDHVAKRRFYRWIAVINTAGYTALAFASCLPDFLAVLGDAWTMVAAHGLLAVLYASTWRIHHYSKQSPKEPVDIKGEQISALAPANKIKPPANSENYEGREVDCVEALRATFVSTIGTAQEVGWKPDETGNAFLKLSKEVFAAKT